MAARNAPSQDAQGPCAVACCVGATTTVQRAAEEVAAFFAGFVAGEGCFSGSTAGSKFLFEIGLGATDRKILQDLHTFLEAGHVYESRRRKPHYDDEISIQVKAFRALIWVVLPLMDAHLPPSYKRQQYLAWRARLLDYWEHKAKRVRPCVVEGCDKPRRAHKLCRHHLYEQYGM